MTNTYALIMAGGPGTRLWPLSREDRPKSVLPLIEPERSMFQISVERLAPLFPPERVLVVANAGLTALLREQTSGIPPENFIVEPAARDTAPAVGLGSIHIRRRDPEAVVAVLTADHYIADEEGFRAVLGAACRAAAGGSIVTLGIKPAYPATGFGYIERGDLAETLDGIPAYRLQRFVEKPDLARAEQFARSGRYSWNSGMFIWPVSRLMNEMARYAPDLSARLEQIAAVIGTPQYDPMLAALWQDVEKISVDYALMEHLSKGVRVIPADIGWSDIGNFEALYDILSEGGDHVFVGREPLILDSQGLLVVSKRLVAAVGLRDLVIIDTDDVLLVCPRDHAQDVKKLVETLKTKQQSQYL